MKIDHLVVNIDKKYQNDDKVIESIRSAGFPYMPKWGKQTSGFKVSNIWIGKEYFELVYVKKKNNCDWKMDWAKMYNENHRGLICLMLDVEDIEKLYSELNNRGIAVTKPEFLKFKWFFKLFTKVMPWKNCYIPFFEKTSFQIGFQQMKDDAARNFMEQYMVPNSSDNGIEKISKIICNGTFTENDITLLEILFDKRLNKIDKDIIINLDADQTLVFREADKTYFELITTRNADYTKVNIENIQLS
ncbi:MAG: hypothetical protein ACRDA4_03755 [Filifactoraceae bacterium]